MFCPHCGSQQPDTATFCGVCGNPISAAAPSAAPSSAPAQAPAFQPAPQPAPASVPVAAAPKKLSSASPLGRRTAAMLTGALITLIMMFQAWFDLPVVSKAFDMFVSSAGSTGQYMASFKNALSTGLSVPDLPSISSALGAMADYINQLIQMTYGYGMQADPTMQSAQQVVNLCSMASFLLTALFVLWIICLVGIVVGVALRAFKGIDVVLFFALAATAVLALVCIIAVFVINGIIEGAVNGLMMSGTADASAIATVSGFKPFMSPGIGAVLTLLAAVASAVCGIMFKD